MSTEGWQVKMMDFSAGDSGGYKNVVLEVSGDAVYSKLKWEAGVHRVQRVPATETQGRVHTSTATVAIMVSRKAGGRGRRIDMYIYVYHCDRASYTVSQPLKVGHRQHEHTRTVTGFETVLRIGASC